jgi:raffinose/stachyose/melibiose transport system permease protein
LNTKIKGTLTKIFVQIIFIIFGITIFFSIYYLVVNSFKTPAEFANSQFSLPGSLNFSKIIEVWTKGKVGIAFKNSLIIGVSTVVLTTIIGSLAGYAFSSLKFRAKKFLYFVVISTMFFSPMIFLIPLYMQYTKLGLINSYAGVIIIYTATQLAFATFLITTFFRGIPIEIIEAATIDGCSRLRILKNIMLPLSVPVLLSLMLLTFYSTWNDLLIGIIFLQKEEMQNIMVAVSQFRGRLDTSPTSIFASMLIATIPIMILYAFTQKYYVKGMTLGSIK